MDFETARNIRTKLNEYDKLRGLHKSMAECGRLRIICGEEIREGLWMEIRDMIDKHAAMIRDSIIDI